MFQERVALVTGGARGIGAAAVRLLAQRGFAVVVNYVQNAEAAAGLVAEVEAAGGKAVAVRADVTRPDDVQWLVKNTMERYGRLDSLVSNAAIRFAVKPFLQMSWAEFSQKLDNELRSAFELSQAVLPIMQQQRYGRIVYVASGLARRPGPGFIAHGTAKAGLVSFARYIAQEFGPFGITANVVSPGLVETDATAHQAPEAKARAAAMTPLGRVAQPDDIAGAIAFFAGDDSKFMTGVYAPVNGGSAME